MDEEIKLSSKTIKKKIRSLNTLTKDKGVIVESKSENYYAPSR